MTRPEPTRCFGYDLYYAPKGEGRTLATAAIFSAGTVSPETRDAQIRRDLKLYGSQDYEFYRIELRDECPVCAGYGRVAIFPKGWRRKKPCPHWMLKWKLCPGCSATGLTGSTTIEGDALAALVADIERS